MKKFIDLMTGRDHGVKAEGPTDPAPDQGGFAGYMTAEAAMIVPAVFALIIMLLYLTFFMYDRCVMTQDLYTAAYRVSIQRGNASSQTGDLDTSGYFMLNGCSAGVSGGKEVRAFSEGSMAPAIVTGVQEGGDTWKLSVSMKARKTDPPFSFRRFRRILAIARLAEQSAGLSD